MKTRDIISRIVDNYYKICIEVFDPETNLIKKRHYIQPHKVVLTDIPEDVLDLEVKMIVPHFDSLVISVSERKEQNK